ncbi:MAG TPA: CHAD domain-containing protein [Candidatus Angelobacter sp.]|nr:CHAD domain-containing protein [Candidatus Angelobacter sp.]
MTLLEQPIRGLTKDLSRTLSKLSDGSNPKSIHRLRTTIRRIESIVGYARPGLGKKLERSLEVLEDLRKRAGKVRNLDVQKKLLEKIGNGSTAKDRKKLADVLDKKREKQLERLNPALARCADKKFLARVEKVADRVALVPSEPGQILAPLEEARLELARMADRFSSHSIKPNRLHQARIQLKKLRYVAELAQESPEGKVFVAEIKTVQDTVGEWHDWEELARLAEKHFADRANCALLREIRALFAARQAAAISAITRLFASVSAPPAKKPPAAVQPIRLSVRSAG